MPGASPGMTQNVSRRLCAPDSTVKQPSFIALIHKGALARPCYLSGAGYAVVPPRFRGAFLSPPGQARGNGAPSGATINPYALRRRRPLRKDARHSALHGGDFCSPGPRFLGRGIFASPSPAGSLRSGPSAARSGPEASRGRGYEPRPQAPHPLPLSERLMTTPSEGEDAMGI